MSIKPVTSVKIVGMVLAWEVPSDFIHINTCVLTDCFFGVPFLKDKQDTEVTNHLVIVSFHVNVT